ncbi:hypothetical protein QZH41_016835 [Actinostola sp. cb2023]|nr:hypothetical protein QZH41_016835 [Actinostola sp. cb2023]
MSELVKQKEYEVEDSNVENIGSEEDRAVKKAAALTELAWEGAGEEFGLQIWRINQFKVEIVKKEEHGIFYIGDSYIVLHTYKHPVTELMEYDLFFWIGKNSTQDEYGTAAYKTVELDTLVSIGT